MNPGKYRDDVIPQDTGDDDSTNDANTDEPLSEAEIEDLLYGEGRSTEERLELLRALRQDLNEREDADFGDDDPGALIQEIDKRIAELEGDESQNEEPGVLDTDPLAHRETLSPDSDELEELEEEDEESLDEEDEWLDEEETEDEDDEDEGDIDNDDDVRH